MRHGYAKSMHSCPADVRRRKPATPTTSITWAAVCTATRTVLTADADNFYVQADIDAYEGEHRVFCRTFDATVPRGHV